MDLPIHGSFIFNARQGFIEITKPNYIIFLLGFYVIMKVIYSEVARMRWEEVREQFPNEWVVCEALKSRSEDGYWFVDEVAVIDRFDDSSVAMKRYYELHREQPYREYGFFHTSREKLELREKLAGVRGPR